MKKIKISRFGVTMAEVAVAVLIFAVAAIPLYRAISFGAKQEINLDKEAQANKILTSFKEECSELDYDAVDNFKPKIDGSNVPQKTFKNLLEVQKKYKDFKFEANLQEKKAGDIESLLIEAEVKWTKDGGGEASRKLSFVKVKR